MSVTLTNWYPVFDEDDELCVSDGAQTSGPIVDAPTPRELVDDDGSRFTLDGAMDDAAARRHGAPRRLLRRLSPTACHASASRPFLAVFSKISS